MVCGCGGVLESETLGWSLPFRNVFLIMLFLMIFYTGDDSFSFITKQNYILEVQNILTLVSALSTFLVILILKNMKNYKI